MRNVCRLAALVLLGVASNGLAEGEVSTKKLSYALLPEGKTLPAGVARFRLPYQIASGSSSYNEDGKKVDSPVKFSATGAALVAEYGLTDKISLQWKTDYVVNQKAEINRSSSTFSLAKAAIYAEKTAKLAPNITDQASLQNAIRGAFIMGCVKSSGQTTAQCGALYESGNLPSTGATDLGLAASFGAGSDAVPAKAYAAAAAAATEAKIEKGMSPSGKGMGDTILGVLYEAYDSGSTFVALAGGVRIPTGNHDLKFAELDSTRGAWEAGARINVDLLPVDWFMVSWQNQSEVGLFGASHKEDGVTVDTKRNGVRNVGFVYLKPSLAALAPALESLRASVGVTYDFDSALVQTANGVETTGARSEMMWNYASLGYSLIGMDVPLQFDVEHEMPNRGKNAPIATTKTTYTVKAFARF